MRAEHTAIDAIKRECQVLASVDHPFVVDLVHYYEDEVRGCFSVRRIDADDLVVAYPSLLFYRSSNPTRIISTWSWD